MSPYRVRIAGATAAIMAALAATAFAQARPTIQDVTLPVIPLDLPISNLDQSVTIGADRVTLTADVLFAFNSARLSAKGRARVAETAREVRRRRSARLRVVGHTDSKGSTTYNLDLSRRRAAAVARQLKAALGGGDTPSIATSGRGEQDPVAANTASNGTDSPRGRARNRRVEIHLEGQR